MQIDFEVSSGGTVYLFKPLTPAARAWVDDHAFIGPIVGATIGDGLIV